MAAIEVCTDKATETQIYPPELGALEISRTEIGYPDLSVFEVNSSQICTRS